MTVFEIARVSHILCAVLWVGGGVALAVGAEFARQQRDENAILAVVKIAALLGPRFFVPASLMTLVTGSIAALNGPGFGEFWVMVGLAGAAATFLTGLLVLKPRAEEIERLMAGHSAQRSILVAKSLALLRIARFDHVVLLIVVAVMSLKPSSGDISVLVSMGLVLLLGAAVTFTGGVLRGQS